MHKVFHMPIENRNGYASATKCLIDFKPGFKSQFGLCLETYLKNDLFGHEVTLEGPFL